MLFNSILLLSAQVPLQWNGILNDKIPGWNFEPSNPENGMSYNPYEGYYPDKGGKLSSPLIHLLGKDGEPGYYRIRFNAESRERAYQGVDFFDAEGKRLPDCYDVIYPGSAQNYDRVIYAMEKVAAMKIFFRSRSGIRIRDLQVDSATVSEAADYCDRVYSECPALNFQAPGNAMEQLPKTTEALLKGTSWHVLMLGDSIMQDTFHSLFHALLKREYPSSNFRFTISVRGSTGCWFYCQADNFKKYVLDESKPDLVMIGGISNYLTDCKPGGAEAVEIVIRAIKAHYPKTEIVILSAPLAADTRPHDSEHPTFPLPARPWIWEQDRYVRSAFKKDLVEMARRNGVAFWDISTPSYTWLYQSCTPYEWHNRDMVHSGERGKQIIARIMMEYFKTISKESVK